MTSGMFLDTVPTRRCSITRSRVMDQELQSVTKCDDRNRTMGAGKTTFAREFLPREAGVIHFVNADLIASGLSPLRPELAARQAGRLLLAELDRLAAVRTDFAFETTFSGRTYLHLLRQWKAAGYRIEMVFLSLPSVQLAFQRIAARVRQGGHNVLRADVVRRFERSQQNFRVLYRPLAHTWVVYDNSGEVPRLLEEGP